MTEQSKPLEVPAAEPTERFIRTFASDSAAVKAGTLPGLSRQAEAPPPPPQKTAEDFAAEKAAAEPEVIHVDLGASSYDPADLGKFPDAPSASAAERLVGESPFAPEETTALPPVEIPQEPPPAPAPEPLPAVAPEPVAEEDARLHTYSSDFAEHVTEQGASPVAVLAAEQDAGPAPTAADFVPKKEKSSASVYIAAGILLVIAGAGIALATYWLRGSAPAPVATLTPPVVRIFVDDRATVSGTGRALAQAIEEQVQKPLAAGAVRAITTANATSTDKSVFSALQFPAPDVLLRNIYADGSMAGIVNASEQSPFFLLSVQSYGDTFAGMLAWEPHMAQDLKTLFPPSSGASASAQYSFIDKVVANHDARALRDSAGHTMIIYGYWDPSSLIIAHDESAFTELVSRLATSRTQK